MSESPAKQVPKETSNVIEDQAKELDRYLQVKLILSKKAKAKKKSAGHD